MKVTWCLTKSVKAEMLPVVALGALSQVAQADTLDDAIKDAKDAGFPTSVFKTRTEKKYPGQGRPPQSRRSEPGSGSSIRGINSRSQNERPNLSVKLLLLC